MTNYDFSTLNSTDLENLVCELLNADQPVGSEVKYRTFKEGKDQGIDLLYSTDKYEHEHVGQVKHYLKTGWDGLYRDLKNKEVDKVNKLKPNRYIFATSLEINKKNCKSLESLFNPYIKSLSDIYGKDDLNRLITKYKEVEKSTFKLWFSSSNVLESILNSDLDFRSTSFIEDELIKRIKLFVITPVFKEARIFLKEKNFIIITGEPGSGKTTLAEMLLYEYIKDGYELSYIIDDVHDAEREIKNDDSKQIIYFDDFLGSNEIEIKKAMASEARLLRLISQIEKKNNKLLILTTRSNLFSKAISASEKLQRRKAKLNEKTINLKTYDENIREHILNNHIEVSSMNDEFKSIIKESKLKRFIINHNNFYPRIIEYITSSNQLDKLSPNQYEEFIRSSIDSSASVWEYAYLTQTNIYEKLLLQTLLTFGDSVNLSLLEKAFNKRINYEIEKRNLASTPHIWKKTIKQLLDGFIILKRENVKFINPSLVDFLVSYLKEDDVEVEHIVNNLIHIEQLSKWMFRLSASEQIEMPVSLQTKLLNEYNSFLSDDYSDAQLIHLVLIINLYVIDKRKDDVISELLKEVEDWMGLIEDAELNTQFVDFLYSIDVNSKSFEIIQINIEEILNDLLLGEWDIDKLLEVIKEYSAKFNMEDFISPDVEIHISRLFEEKIFDTVEDLKEWVMSEGDEIEELRKIEEKIEEYRDLNISIDVDFKCFTDVDWWEIANNNYLNYALSKND